eukprot:gene52739-64442_t
MNARAPSAADEERERVRQEVAALLAQPAPAPDFAPFVAHMSARRGFLEERGFVVLRGVGQVLDRERSSAQHVLGLARHFVALHGKPAPLPQGGNKAIVNLEAPPHPHVLAQLLQPLLQAWAEIMQVSKPRDAAAASDAAAAASPADLWLGGPPPHKAAEMSMRGRLGVYLPASALQSPAARRNYFLYDSLERYYNESMALCPAASFSLLTPLDAQGLAVSVFVPVHKQRYVSAKAQQLFSAPPSLTHGGIKKEHYYHAQVDMQHEEVRLALRRGDVLVL